MPISEETHPKEHSPIPRFGPPTTANPLWRAVVVTGTAFVLSCLLWIMSGVGETRAPAKQWLNRHGVLLVIVSGVASVGAAISAMVVDGIQTSRMSDSQEDLHDPSSLDSSDSQP